MDCSMISIVTPTFNRSYTLLRLFESLMLQTELFEWVVIDDGSTDGTQHLINSFKAKAHFPIQYFYQNNQGKHVALNCAALHVKGEFLFIVDSDDYLTHNALMHVKEALEILTPEDIGVCFRRMYHDGKLVGRTLPLNDTITLSPTQASSLFKGDLVYIFRAKQFRLTPFPVFEDEIFVPELYLWNQLAKQGSIRFYPSSAIYVCEYLPDGYSANFYRNFKHNPKGFGLFYYAQMFEEKSLLSRIKYFIRWVQSYMYRLKKAKL